MATMDELLQEIASAVYGREVRSSIHDGLKMCYDEGQSAKSSAAESATSAASAKSEADAFIADVQEKLDKGELTGKGLTILGYYQTLDALKAAVPSASAGDCYGVGTASPYDIYVYDGVNKTWVNNGSMGTAGILPKGGDAGQMLMKSTSEDYDSTWADPPASPVTSVNGQTGNVQLSIPTVPTLVSKTSDWNQEFTGVQESYNTLISLTVPTTGLYLLEFMYAGTTAFSARAFVEVGDNFRQGLPLNQSFPVASVTRLCKLEAGATVNGQVYTSTAGTYAYQFTRLQYVLLQAD